jgi:hypothetical protein
MTIIIRNVCIIIIASHKQNYITKEYLIIRYMKEAVNNFYNIDNALHRKIRVAFIMYKPFYILVALHTLVAVRM